MNLKRCVLADLTARLPMPDRGLRIFSTDGETVDIDRPFWRNRLDDGEIVIIKETEAPAADQRGKRKGK
jgi:hypothetical protein